MARARLQMCVQHLVAYLNVHRDANNHSEPFEAADVHGIFDREPKSEPIEMPISALRKAMGL